jgi:hypothetical protein
MRVLLTNAIVFTLSALNSFSAYSQSLENCISANGLENRVEARLWWDSSARIIEAFQKRNAVSLASFYQGDLEIGPSRNEILKYGIEEYFDNDVIEQLANETPICGRFNSQGSFLLNGSVWFDLADDGKIFFVSMPGAKDDFNYGAPGIPKVSKNKYINPQCIEVEWRSSDNFEAYAARYGVSLEQVSDTPLLKADKRYMEEFCPFGARKDSKCSPADKDMYARLRLLRPLEQCAYSVSTVKQSLVTENMVSSPGGGASVSYKVLGLQSRSICQPLVGGGFVVDQCFLAEKREGRNSSRLGLFSIVAGKYVGPVKYFDSYSSVREYLRRASAEGEFNSNSSVKPREKYDATGEVAVENLPHREIEKRLGMSLNQARDHQEVKLANGWQFYFLLTKGKRSSDDQYDAVFNFFLFDEHGTFRSSKSFTKLKHILETDGGQTAHKLNAKSFATLSVRDWVIELRETYDVEAPDEIDGAAATYFSSYSNVFLVAIDKESSEMTLALDSLQTGLVTGLAKPSSSSAVFWDQEERLQRILVPQKGKDFPNLLVRVRQCTSSRSKTSCADTGGYKKWKNEAIYIYRDGKYEKQAKKGE